MPSVNIAPVNHRHAASGDGVVPRILNNRTRAFGCATLRDNFRQFASQVVMAKGEHKNAKAFTPSTATPVVAVPGTFFLRTKLLAPRPAPELLFRERLIEKLRTNLSLPMTLVTANAGSGKTTLVADFLRQQKRSYVWYQLDHTDSDPAVFVGYLAQGIQRRVPGFGETIFAYLQANELAQQPERAADVLLNEILEHVEQQLIVVLDDYHHLGADTSVHAVVDRLIAYLPDVMHVIIISRDMPPLTLARLRSQDSLAVIDRNDLLFTAQETQELFRKVFGLELTAEQLHEYGERTHGWITALQLVRQVAQRQGAAAEGDAADPLGVLHQSERDIFEYFAEEVFSAEPSDIQKYLMRIALLERIDVETCARLYPELIASAILPQLVRRNVFLTVASDARGEEYRLHPLFQSFLRRRLRTEIGLPGVAAEHVRCADHFLARGDWDGAVRHLLEAEQFDRAGAVISDHGREWIATGKLASLSSLAESLPNAVLDAHPRALAHRAEVARLRGEFETAQTLFRRAAAALRAIGDDEAEAEALHSLATIARRQGDYESAFKYLDRAVELTKSDSPVRAKCGNTRGLCFASQGEYTAAEREFRVALQSAEERNDEHQIRLITHNLGLPAMMRGDFGEALHWLRRMVRTDDREAPIPQEALGHLNIARCHLYRGELDESERHLDLALERCQLFNLVGQLGEALEAYGNLWRERSNFSRAAEFYERASRSYEEAGIDFSRVELLEEQALLSLKAGDVARARAQIDRLVASRKARHDKIGVFTATLALARVRIAEREFHQTRDELLPALEYFRGCGQYYYEAQACIELAACELALENEPQMFVRLRRALDLAARYDYDYWLRQEIARRPALFASDVAQDMLPSDLRGQLSTITVAPVEGAKAVATLTPGPLVDLTVNMLGPVEIFRDPARSFAADAWTTRRARDILCYIVSRRHHRAPKDTIIDTFWAEDNVATIEKNFHPTISHIRKALNSNQPLKQNFIIYRDGDYQLNSEFSYRIDTETFERLISDGESARRERVYDRCIDCYEQAVALYRGEFMQGTYEPWVDEQRSYYREQYLRMLESLAAVAEKKQEWPRTMDLAHRILREDQFREDIHCMLMRTHAALGNRVAVKEQYEALHELLQKELGVEPAAQTQRTFRELMET